MTLLTQHCTVWRYTQCTVLSLLIDAVAGLYISFLCSQAGFSLSLLFLHFTDDIYPGGQLLPGVRALHFSCVSTSPLR